MNQLQMKINMLKRWLNIICGKSATAIKQGKGCSYSTIEIKGYYNDLTGKICQGTKLDEGGLPLSQISETEFAYFPIAVFQYGLGMYDLLLRGDEKADKSILKKIAEWACENQREDGSWDCFGPIKSKYYTVSSMGQGEGASFLFRMANLFECEKYKNIGMKAIDFMLLNMENGGTAIFDRNELFLEEYPENPRRSVLNGWIFSIFGLFDATLIDSERYSGVLLQTVETLAQHLNDYDTGYWSRYDVSGRIASPAYHDLHITLLEVLSDITNNVVFKQKAETFKQYQNKKVNRIRAVFYKIQQKLFEKSDAVLIR